MISRIEVNSNILHLDRGDEVYSYHLLDTLYGVNLIPYYYYAHYLKIARLAFLKAYRDRYIDHKIYK